MGGVLGFDYQAFAEVLKLYGLWRREIHEGLRIIEAEVMIYHAESMRKPDDSMDQTMSLYLAARAEDQVN